jgi:hypothetical protein
MEAPVNAEKAARVGNALAEMMGGIDIRMRRRGEDEQD